MERRDSLDGRLERAKDAALGPHEGHPTVADLVGEAAGGITGVLAGAAIGSLAGPVGTIVGGIAGAIGGWWSGRAISEAVERMTEDDETYYRKHFESSPAKPAQRSFDEVRPVYHLGHIAGMNPDYKGRQFEEIEADLQRGWNDDVRSRYGEWDAVRGYVEEAFNRGQSTPASVSARSTERGEAAGDRPDQSPTRGADEGAGAPADPGRESDRSPGASSVDSGTDSNASQGRSIPRGPDEGSPRP